ncbi:cell division protein FtsQ/DivIB [Thalassoglobus polymorphus]|uniref:Cell division protein FtsQ n=1 Tax=Thalassoglobus polymorphus TaxID=2527994 RepID=A0A517QT38_9PLAN|nr:hypothetical protein [Thalassoglobus polymorphus]QDT34816.1 Cell division protein FtsQ [Thalassoglobus polymorphus]
MPPATKTKKTKGAKPAPKKKAAPKKGPSPVSLAVRSWFFRPTPLIITAFIISGIVFAPYAPHLLPDLSQLEEYQFEMEAIEVNQPNEWVPGTLIDTVLINSEFPERISLLQPNLSRDVAEALHAHPWVHHVDSVRLTNERSIRASLKYRLPVAFVETNEGLFPVDAEGVLLPAVDFKIEDIDKLPHITNVLTKPIGKAGTPWGGGIVESAAKIAAALTPNQNMEKYWNRFELTSIVAPDVKEGQMTADDMTFELATRGGSRVVWGKPPGADDLEPTVQQKIGRMEQYLSRFGKFDEPDGPYRIDIRLFDAISLQPLDGLIYR